MSIKKTYPIVLLGGPTASGKSRLAVDLAKRLGGCIINADSMQIYKELPILTAQPDQDEQVETPHYLYGILSADDICSVGRWQKMALEVIEQVHHNGALPIVVGGTGLYLSALIRGIAAIPPIPSPIRQHARELWNCLGFEKFYDELRALDPLGAQRLNPRDQQRLLRAYEVKKATSISLVEWQKSADDSIAHLRSYRLILLPPRLCVYEAAKERLSDMLACGALSEVETFAKQLPGPSLPLTKALGFRSWREYLEEKISYDEASARTLLETRHYIKRQYTWFRHQIPGACYIEAFPSEMNGGEVASLILKWLGNR